METELEPARIMPLWSTDWWDGPLSGVAEYDGEKMYFSMKDEDDETGRRTFNLYRLTPEQMERELAWHALFKENVGDHTEYGPDGRRRREGTTLKPQEQWAKFYDNYPPYKTREPRHDLSKAELVGWFGRWKPDAAIEIDDED